VSQAKPSDVIKVTKISASEEYQIKQISRKLQ
jgi:hypothetical protein